MSRVFWDTNIFIYSLEDYGKHGQSARDLRERMLRRGDQLITSAMTVGEILVKPYQLKEFELCRTYERTIIATALVIPFDLNAAKHFAAVRLNRFVSPPDAIQLSCAAAVNTDLFVTNDSRLTGLQIEGIQFIVSLDRVPF